jgi:ABC-type glycerol-3-phosphate transport system permease component
MRPINIPLRIDVSITPQPWSPRRLLAWGARRLVLWCMLALAAMFFAVPIVWLLLEATRAGPDSLVGRPLGFGSFNQILLNWQVLFSG